MSEDALRTEYEMKLPLLDACGKYVVDQINNAILATCENLDVFLKVPPSTRVKSVESFIEKALYRNKNYSQPIVNITDQVGVRYVVLTHYDVHKLKQIIESHDQWHVSLDRDYESERLSMPYHFDYQSVHYVITILSDANFNGCNLKNIRCEIQLRTLLQHAYAELTHDLLYKSPVRVPADVKRTAGRSAALIEAVDFYFDSTKETIDQYIQKMETVLDMLDEVCSNLALPTQKSPRLNCELFNMMSSLISDQEITVIQNEIMRQDNRYVRGAKNLINEKGELIYKQPCILLALYFAHKKPRQLFEKWDMFSEYLNEIYLRMGIAQPG